MPSPPPPDPNVLGPKKREMELQIVFAADGHVTACAVISSSGSPKLDRDTASFIKQNWVLTSEAGRTARIPIGYNPAPAALARNNNSNATNGTPAFPSGNHPWGFDTGANAMGSPGSYGQTGGASSPSVGPNGH
jgi:hypothetical protein